MRAISTSTIAILTILLFVHVVSPLTIVGDIRIETVDGVLYCDSMLCPPSASCHVTKRTNPRNFSQIVRNRKCFDINGAVISQETTYEPNIYQEDVNINVVGGGGGGSNIVNRRLTPQEQRQLEESLRRTAEILRPLQDGTFALNLRNSIEESLDSGLRQFRDGSFSRNLRNEINESIKNSLKF